MMKEDKKDLGGEESEIDEERQARLNTRLGWIFIFPDVGWLGAENGIAIDVLVKFHAKPRKRTVSVCWPVRDRRQIE